MKTISQLFRAVLFSGALILSQSATAQSSVVFDILPPSGPVTNVVSGELVPAGATFAAALYYAPDGITDEAAFMQAGPSTGFIAPGRFSGGNRVLPVAPGSTALFQVRVWETAFGGTYEEALAAAGRCEPVLIGKSVIITAVLPVTPGPPTTLLIPAFGVAPPTCLGISLLGDGVRIRWPISSRGFLLEQTSPSPPYAWAPVLRPPVERDGSFTVDVPMEPASRFFRLRPANGPVVAFVAALEGANERPTPVVTPATGNGRFLLEGNLLWFQVDYRDLGVNANAAHFHAPASASATAGPMINIGAFHVGAFGRAGTFRGSVSLNDTQKGYITSGQVYVNIHTATWSGGEIRGQILPP